MSWLTLVAKQSGSISGVSVFLLLMGTLPIRVFAVDLIPDGIGLSGGKYIFDKANISNARIAARWDWDQDFISHPRWKLDGYFDLGYSQWQSHLSVKD